ncbi:GSCFA domain-containing protein [Paracoccus salsus]|uniref:GSCFA domain-containing protein n=1 Tax=Paracoccus salsus TaxID=2911061 RepID=UPI001F1E0998|nr:GSCFA domain-containing protein [Paracoccus salsus]MCF3974711.1 GSCFA domain-containing protein [Paracoccus salsus]
MNPYTDLPQDAFWSPAVAQKHMLDISGLWKAPFPISTKTRIATYGSCFAQHFSRALVARGYSWLNAEPAPRGIPEAEARRFSYGVFSSRTGNIYTTSLLLQWVEWALEKRVPPAIHWEKDGRIHDPFRPTVEPDGFGSVEEMLASRRSCIAAFRKSILESNLFVFTLGLTESWWDTEGGFEYPMCPGTHAGTFDPARHMFRNQDYSFVRANLVKAITLVREHRDKGPRILLTVSPVPLTATNSGNHVLVATMESKSILRAVAGNVAASLKGVGYFPSYEIINSPVFRGTFFEPNLRGVNGHGVAHVMNCFFAGLGADERVELTKSASPRRMFRRNQPRSPSTDDLKCDEEILDAFGGRDEDNNSHR